MDNIFSIVLVIVSLFLASLHFALFFIGKKHEKEYDEAFKEDNIK